MILLTTLKNEADARLLGDALFLEGIAAHVDENKRKDWDLWVVDMDQEKSAIRILEEYQTNPQATRFVAASVRAEEKRRVVIAAEKKAAAPVFTKDTMPGWSGSFELLPVTAFLIVSSIVVTLVSSFRGGWWLAAKCFISQIPFVDGSRFLPEIQNGELWRLITPIFLHAPVFGLGLLHILFNMIWLKDLGGALERRRGSLFLGAMVLVIGVISNIGQYLWAGPSFGGMSGVVFGLLGFIWVQGRLRPFSGLHVPQQVMTMMMLWLLLGFSGAMGVANGCHAVGLVTGVLLGAIPVPPKR